MNFKVLAILTLVTFSTAHASVKAYFNQNQKSSYVEPYRNLHRSGDNLEAVVLEQIYAAKKSIYIAVQELRLPLIAKALVEKKKQGVDVRVVLEHDYNFTVITQRDGQEAEYEATKRVDLFAFVDANGDGIISRAELEDRDAIAILAKGKVPVIDDTSDGSRGSGLMHHKFAIIDGKSVVVTTANFTLSCVHGDYSVRESRGNANSMVVIQSQAVAKIFDEEFSQLWGNGKRGNFGQRKSYRGRQTVSVRGVDITIQFSPTSARYNWEESTNGLVASQFARARSSIKAALFVYTDQKLSNVLEKMHDRNVHMGFLVEQKFAFRDYSELLDMAGIGMLNPKCSYEADNQPWKNPAKEIGVPQLEKGDSLHHKFGVIDDSIVVMGSHNWSDAANYINDETLVVIESKTVANQFAQEYRRLLKRSRMGVPDFVLQKIQNQEKACSDVGSYF